MYHSFVASDIISIANERNIDATAMIFIEGMLVYLAHQNPHPTDFYLLATPSSLLLIYLLSDYHLWRKKAFCKKNYCTSTHTIRADFLLFLLTLYKLYAVLVSRCVVLVRYNFSISHGVQYKRGILPLFFMFLADTAHPR